MPCLVYRFVSQSFRGIKWGIRTKKSKDRGGKKMCLEVVYLRKTKTTFGVGKGPALALTAEAEAGTEDLPASSTVATATIWSNSMSIKLSGGEAHSWLCFSSRVSFDRNVYSIRHLTDIYLCTYTLLPYNSSVTRPDLVNMLTCTKPNPVAWHEHTNFVVH